MFQTAELRHTIPKAEYDRVVPVLRTELLEAQKELAAADRAVVVIVSGVEGAGKSETVNLLLEWMDARGIETHSLWATTEDERSRPRMWRFWRVLPPQGRIGILFGSWYTQPIIDRVFKRINKIEFGEQLDQILQLEQMLGNEKTTVVKFWMHLSEAEQRKRFDALRKDRRRRWKVSALDRKFIRKIDRFHTVSEHALVKTHTPSAPWHVIAAADARYRNLTVGRTLLAAIRTGIVQSKAAPPPSAEPPTPPADVSLLRNLDMTKSLSTEQYESLELKLHKRLNLLSRRLRDRGRSLVLVFEGPDAAGKGGSIRRVTAALDARDFTVQCVGPPTDEERARPYLWRFWRNLPTPGRVAIYDRSWYGRVLVERVEGFCPVEAWKRAYGEINAFEDQLAAFGIIVLKFWLAISPDEQLRRFGSRRTTPFKQYKLTEDDWRNRAKWDGYEAAACEMIATTSRPAAPWVIVEADNKEWARYKVLRSVVRALRQELRK